MHQFQQMLIEHDEHNYIKYAVMYIQGDRNRNIIVMIYTAPNFAGKFKIAALNTFYHWS